MVKINLLPVRASEKKEIILVQLTIAGLMLVLIMAVLGFLHFSLSSKIDTAKSDISKAEAELTRLNKVKAKVDKFKKDSKELEDFSKLLEFLKVSGVVDYNVDLRNHNPSRTWDQGFFDN